MLVHLIASVLVTAIALLLVWAVYRTISRPMPGALYPLIGGACLIGYGIYTEYSWESRTLDQLPESMQVVHRISRPSVFSPWAYLVPRTTQLSLIDSAALRTNDRLPGMVMTDLLIMQRLYPTARVAMMLDCTRHARADLLAEQAFAADGRPLDVDWISLRPDHPLLETACNAG